MYVCSVDWCDVCVCPFRRVCCLRCFMQLFAHGGGVMRCGVYMHVRIVMRGCVVCARA